MATLENLVVRVMRKRRMNDLPEVKKYEIRQEVVDGIRIVQDQVPADALKDLLGYAEFTMNGDSFINHSKVDVQKFISLKVQESDGDYGYPWTEVNRQLFDEIKRNEQEADQDSTDTRIFCTQSQLDIAITDIDLDTTIEVAPEDVAGYDLYPTPVEDRVLRIDYIQKASESGTMTLPTHLHLAVILYASGMYNEFADEINRISRNYRNRYGLTPASVSIGRGL